MVRWQPPFIGPTLAVGPLRDSLVHQIHSALLSPSCEFSVAACSLGRGHAPQRIDLYPAGTLRPLTTIDIHVSRESKAAVVTKLLLGFVEPSIFPVAARLTARTASLIPP